MGFKDLQTYLLEEDGQSLKVENGVVTSVAQPTPLPKTPDGWFEMVIAWERSLTRFGVIRNFSFPLAFIGDGARILNTVFHKQNVERKIFLLIQKLKLFLTDATYQLKYGYLYRGELDLSTFNQEDVKTTVNIMEGGLAKQLKVNEATPYDISMADDFVFVRMDGLLMTQKINFIVEANGTAADSLVGLLETTREGAAPGVGAFTIYLQPEPSDLTTSLQYFLVTTQVITGIKLVGKVKVRLTAFSGTYNLRLKSNLGRNDVIYSHAYVSGDTLEFDVNYTFTSAAGERFFLVGDVASAAFSFYSETNLSVTYSSRYRETFVKAFHPAVLNKKLVRAFTGSENNTDSTLLTERSNICIASGDAIRGLAGALVKTKYSDFLDFVRVVMMGGCGIEGNKIVVESLAHFLKTDNPIDAGEAKDFKASYAADLVANTIKVGYPDPQVDDVNGKYEPNASLVFSTPITRVVKELSLICPYVASPYEIESLRINLDGKDTTDSNTDNKCYLLNIDLASSVESLVATVSFVAAGSVMIAPLGIDFIAGQKIRITGSASNDQTYTVTGAASTFVANIVTLDHPLIDEANVSVLIEWTAGAVYDLNRPAYSSITGIPTETVGSIFNISELTPKELMLANAAFIRSIMYGFDAGHLTFTSAVRNADFKTVLGGVTIEQKADVNIGALAPRLFKPIYFEAACESVNVLSDDLDNDPTRSFKLGWKGSEYNGIMIKVAIAPESEKEQTFKLLCGPDTDNEKLANA